MNNLLSLTSQYRTRRELPCFPSSYWTSRVWPRPLREILRFTQRAAGDIVRFVVSSQLLRELVEYGAKPTEWMTSRSQLNDDHYALTLLSFGSGTFTQSRPESGWMKLVHQSVLMLKRWSTENLFTLQYSLLESRFLPIETRMEGMEGK